MIFEPSGDSAQKPSRAEDLTAFPPSPRPSTASPRVAWDTETPTRTVIKVLGVGGGGCNAVQSMVGQGFEGVEFYAINTDHQALMRCKVPNRVQIGENLTQGSGAGALPSIGEQAAREAEDKIREILTGADMIFITAGLGGGTGTGAAPVIAEIARSMNILNVAIVTKPFHFEGTQRMRRAEDGGKKLAEHVDTMIAILNDKLMEVVGPKTPLTEGFEVANTVLAQGIRAISDLISTPGLINVDFRDVRTIMGETGGAVMGVGIGKGENRAVEAVRKACHSPLQEKIVIDGARGILINITGPASITMHEINEATSLIYEMADPDANVIFGVVIDEKMNDAMRVTIIATGFGDDDDGGKDFRSRSAADKLRPRTSPITPGPGSSSMYEAPGSQGLGPSPTSAYATPAAKVEEEASLEPAILRKRKGQPGVDFGSEDNPLRDWDRDTPVTDERDDDPLPSPAPSGQASHGMGSSTSSTTGSHFGAQRTAAPSAPDSPAAPGAGSASSANPWRPATAASGSAPSGSSWQSAAPQSASPSHTPGSGSAHAPSSPSSETPERRTPTSFVTNPFSRRNDEPKPPSGPVMSDSDTEDVPGPNDPYFETPALHRRRRQRFFE